MSVLKKEKDVKDSLDVENFKSDEINVMRHLAKQIVTKGIVLTVFVFTRTYKEASHIIKDVAPDIEPKPGLTLADLQEMIKDSSVTQEQATELESLIAANDIEGLLNKMLSMPEFRDKIVQKLAASL